MYKLCEKIDPGPGLEPLFKQSFKLSDQAMVQSYLDRFLPWSCEYNFANLFCWQDIYQYFWQPYCGRLLVYDAVSQSAFMPLGETLSPHKMARLSEYLICNGLAPDIGIVPKDYVDRHPEIEKFYSIEEDRDSAEYIYLAKSLYELTGNRLHKKRNLISQFKRLYPNFAVKSFCRNHIPQALDFAGKLLKHNPVKNLAEEFSAMEKAFENFEFLNLEGLVFAHEDKMIGFSIFSRLNRSCYNIQFEKSDFAYKGAGQVINQETAGFLKDKCIYINREQDLGVKGLRQAKMSYEPERLEIPYLLKFRGIKS